MKKTWSKPLLDVLNVNMTMNGPGKSNADCFDTDDHPGNGGVGQDPALSNASCLGS